MKADPQGVLTGTHFIDGDDACCEGGLAAGARFAAGYPITPSTEVEYAAMTETPCVLRRHAGIAPLVVRQSRDVKFVAFACMRHLRDQVAVGA